MKGKVKWFDAGRGYGFIAQPHGPDLYVHHSAIQGERELQKGEEVEFEIEEGPKGRQVVRLIPVRQRKAS